MTEEETEAMALNGVIEQVRAQHPEAHADELVVLVEDKIRADVRSVKQVLVMYRSSTRERVRQILRREARQTEERAIPRQRQERVAKRRGRTVRPPANSTHRRRPMNELREQFRAEGLEDLMKTQFTIGRGRKILWQNATVDHHRTHIEMNALQVDTLTEDIRKHELSIQTIEATEGARTLGDVVKLWNLK
jgi:hypothetical protein